MESINAASVLQEAGDADSTDSPDPKCKLNILSFLTLPDLSDFLISNRNSMSIVLLLQMMGGGGGGGELGGGWLIYNMVWEGGQRVDIIL